MKNQLIIKELEEMSTRINSLIEELKKDEDISEEVKVINKGLMLGIIKKYVRENGSVLNREMQRKLQVKLYHCNNKENVSLVKIFKFLEVDYEWIKNEEDDWKNIKIIIE